MTPERWREVERLYHAASERAENERRDFLARLADDRSGHRFPQRLVAHPDRTNFAAYEYDVAVDGSRFLINRLISPPDESLSTIVDWNPPR